MISAEIEEQLIARNSKVMMNTDNSINTVDVINDFKIHLHAQIC